MAPEKNLPQKKMPDIILVSESGAEHQNVPPRFAAHRLGRVTQRVVGRQIAVADDFQRDREDDQNDDGPNRQRKITPDRIQGRGIGMVVVFSHAGQCNAEDQNTTGTPSSSIRTFCMRFSFDGNFDQPARRLVQILEGQLERPVVHRHQPARAQILERLYRLVRPHVDAAE